MKLKERYSSKVPPRIRKTIIAEDGSVGAWSNGTSLLFIYLFKVQFQVRYGQT